MELSQKIKQFIKIWEGCRLTAYRCPAGVLTIGYGHTGSDVKPGMKITYEQADALFEADIKRFADSVAPLFEGVQLSQNQFDALVSLSYNIGSLKVKAPTLLAKVKANPNNPDIRTEFARHCNARVNGVLKPLAGLQKRRMAEANHYFGTV